MLLTTRAAMKPIMERFRAGDNVAAVDGFMQMVAGPAYRAPLARALPHAFEQAIASAETFFGQEVPAIQTYRKYLTSYVCFRTEGRANKV